MSLLCEDLKCKHTILLRDNPDLACLKYPRKYQEFVTRQGYCPVIDDGPNKKKPIVAKKERAGQQKQKKK